MLVEHVPDSKGSVIEDLAADRWVKLAKLRILVSLKRLDIRDDLYKSLSVEICKLYAFLVQALHERDVLSERI